MSEEETIKVKKVEIEGKKYLLDKRTNIVYDRETQEPIGTLKDGKLDLYDEEEEEGELTELTEDNFSSEKDWESIRPLDLQVSKDSDGNIDVWYKKDNKELALCSEILEDDWNEGDIEDIVYVMYPLIYNIPHSRQVVPVSANFLVGFVGENIPKKDATIFSFPIFWDGTISVEGDIEKLYNDIDTNILTKPVGKFIVELDLGGDEVSIDDYDIDDRQGIIRDFINQGGYKVEFNKNTNIPKIIDKVFIKPQDEMIRQGQVTILTERGKEQLRKERKEMAKVYNSIRDRLKTLSKKPDIRSKDLLSIKEDLKLLKYPMIDDDANEYGASDKEMIDKVKTAFNNILKKYRDQKETRTTISNVTEAKEEVVAAPIEMPTATASAVPDREQELQNQVDNAMNALRTANERFKVTRAVADGKEALKYKREYEEAVKLLKEERTKKGKGIVDNPELYEKAKQIADEKYKKPSAYKSGFIIKKYKELGGTYSGDKPKTTGIARWFKEEWKDVGNKEYPVYRPTKRVTIETPLTPNEIKPSNMKKQIALKQEIKGDANLPPFEPKTGGKVVALGVQAEKIPKADDIWKWSNPEKVAEMAKKYLGDMAVVFRSTKPKKKYMIFDPDNKKWVFFGEMGYEDFTKHQDPKRRENYLTRTASMKGNWKNNRYSANNLSRNILW